MEDEGLVTPERTVGKTRRYSDSDLTQIAEASELAEQGINAAGIRYALELHAMVVALKAENKRLRREIAELRNQAPEHSPGSDDRDLRVKDDFEGRGRNLILPS